MKRILLLIILNCIVLSCINDNAVTFLFIYRKWTLQLQLLSKQERNFIHCSLKQPLILKYPYIYIVIFPHTYTIAIDSYKITQEIIREGTIYGY